MGTYIYWACDEKRQYIDPQELGDNLKQPVDQAAVAVFLLLQYGEWQGCSVRLYDDRSDLPWEKEGGRAAWGWLDVSNVAKAALGDEYHFHADEPAPGIYRNTRVCDELPSKGRDRWREYLPRGDSR